MDTRAASALSMCLGLLVSSCRQPSAPGADAGASDATVLDVPARGDAPSIGCRPAPPGASYVDPDAPEGVEPETTRCTRLMRVGSLAAVPEVVRAMPGRFNVTYTYLYLADDDAIVMIDAGFTHWVTGASGGTPTVEENLALRDTLDAAIDALSPGHTLADVAAVYFEHGHIDHTMQARWVHEASGRPLDVYLGEGDVALVTSRDAALACTGQLPAAAAPYLPLYLAPDYVLHPVPTARSAAKRASGRRFHALYGLIWRRDVLWEAWRRVRANRGAAGIDGQSIRDVEQQGIALFLEELGEELRAGEYRPREVLRRYIPKADGKRRPLGIPTVRDRVVQMAAKLVLEPIFEADFLPCSYGFRPKRSATMALEALRKRGAKGGHHVLDADIRDYFGSIEHDKLMKLLARRISDRRVLKLVRQWLEAGVMEDGVVSATVAGTPQGGVISPLLSNIYLHVLDVTWTRHSAPLGMLVRYADDFVVMCRTKKECEQAEARVRVILARLGLELHPDKTRRVELYDGKEGFDFLGCHLHKRMSGTIWERERRAVYFLNRWPSQRAMKRVRQRVKELTPRSRCHADLREVIRDLNPVLRGWGNYFRTGNASRHFVQIDRYVVDRLRSLRVKRKGRNLRRGEVRGWARESFENLGLHRLRGTIAYPEQPFWKQEAA